MLADFGATVLRIDRPTSSTESTADNLTRRKASVAIPLKSRAGSAFFRELLQRADVLIDPYRPGVLEKLGFGPSELERLNPRLIVARLTGFRRDGPYKDMAGHDINYIALAGVLAMLGRKDEKPYAPGNLLADFGGGGLMCFTGILLALLNRVQTGRGQIVESNMVDGAAYLASMPRFAMGNAVWNSPRGENFLDGGCPWYDTYQTKDGQFVAVGCLEPQFYDALLKGLGFDADSIPPREDRENWPRLKTLFTQRFQSKTRKEWERVFDGTDACVTPALTYPELQERGFRMRPPFHLSHSPGLAVSSENNARSGQGPGVDGEGFVAQGLHAGEGGEQCVFNWLGWKRGKQYDIKDGGYVVLNQAAKAQL